MDVMENAAAWSDDFRDGWLAHLERTGEIDWKLYKYVRNREPVVAAGIDPGQAKLLLVSTAGAYLKNGQEPFDAADPVGDYSIRTFPTDTPLEDLTYAHDHYDHAAREKDPRVNLPLGYLAEMAGDGRLGGLAGTVVSCSGYHTDAGKVMSKVVPEILRIATEEQVQAALLVPV